MYSVMLGSMDPVGGGSILKGLSTLVSRMLVPLVVRVVVVVGVLGITGVQGSSEAWLKSEKHAEFGTEIQLPCILKLPQCIGLHSIKWYQGNERIFVYSAEGDLPLANEDVASRMSLVVPKNNMTKSYLKISNVTLEDEALYKCEVTYLAVNRECNTVQHITLNVTVAPTSVRVVDESTKQTLEDGRVLGPVIEGSAIALRCESGKGRPVPEVEWYNGNTRLKSESSSRLEEHEIGTGSGTLNLVVARSELGATFTCKVSSLALAEPLKIDIKLDVHVRPMKMDITGVAGHVIQGSKVLLQCQVQGARPAANITWYNGTEVLEKGNPRLDMYDTEMAENQVDGTTQTNSFLAFTASEHDNGRRFSCAASNPVMLKEGSKPMKETVIIEVMYPPIVQMSPQNLTVNETDDFQMFCDYEANPATLINVIWQRDGKNLTLSDERYEGGTTDLTSLVVKNASNLDIGRYTCILENDFGSSTSQDFIEVNVLYRPQVTVSMDPDSPINEASRINVSLSCDVISGNPGYLSSVRWYLDDELLKELPDCTRNASSEEFCDIDPSKLLLESVGRSFHGNYSCEGRNDAGWGPISSEKPVVVHYKPGPASISYEPRRVVKKGPLNITCSVKDPGRPEAWGFKWFRGAVRLSEENEPVYRVDKVRLENRENFTCMAYNEAGDGDSATTFVNISAPPAFIKKLPQLVGFVYNATSVSLSCHVECSPLCDVIWMKNNRSIDFSRTQLYYVESERAAPNRSTDDFESVHSSLIWNLTAWPSGQLDRLVDNDNTFTCASSSNGIGPGVASTVKIEIYFPPESLTISRKVVNVIVDNIPEPIMCNATARPDPQYRWYREGRSDIISEGPVLHFKTPFSRSSRGTYICQANNKIGSANVTTYINVQYKPECQIDKEQMDGKDYVVCIAEGNPSEYGYKWSLKSDNDTIEQMPIVINGKSYLALDEDVTIPRTYVCVANNTIGLSNPCERHVPASIPWYLRLDGDLLVLVIASTVVVILISIVICVSIFLMCRRKHSKLKYPSQTANSNHMDNISEGLSEPETKTFYENLPFHGIQSPPNKSGNIYDYKEHYQQLQQPHSQELQHYGYPLASNSSGQMTLPLSRTLYHSSTLTSPLQPSYTHANSRHSLNTISLQHQQHQQIPYQQQRQLHEHAATLGLLQQQQQDVPDLAPHQHDYLQQRRPRSRRKHNRAKSKQRQKQQQQQQLLGCETSFEQEMGMPESYKISYPHYYEDSMNESCPPTAGEYDEEDGEDGEDVGEGGDSESQQQQYAEPQQLHSLKRSKLKRYGGANGAKLTELHFPTDVGQEINV